ncbi:aldehyde dehydrogenase family protein [uncultured Alsobacter sp.]|uniref:aldehyde dehydrogenase family protein n=1 Tax=uncultured Alsobacter sp. TaxID=1748258 RepID=UPI0025F8307B|nr:aldehyde dehydrogenase family protein [uncultured Alsobacter sp.]
MTSFDPAGLAFPAAHFIGGRMVGAPAALELRRPSDGEAFAACPVADADVVDRAVSAARAALAASGWGGLRPRERTQALHRWADLIEAQAEPLARLEAVASTRPISALLEGDLPVTVEQIRFFAEFADKEGGDLVPTADDSFGFVATEPYGVVGAITPWNFPLSMAAWKLAPALAAGNAVVLKPSEMTPFATLRMAELSVQAGIPAGVIAVVLGDGPETGAALVAHPDVAKVSFTGSTAAGSAIMANLARTGVKPMTLELGGKSPQVVFADADLDLAASSIAGSVLANAGQACVAGTRLVVQASVAGALVDGILERISGIRPGPTWDAATRYSPIVSQRQLGRVDAIVRRAVDAGATVLAGGAPLEGPGYFYAPTVLADVGRDSPAILEEIFGPVLTVQIFEDEDEAVVLADHPSYGLAAGLYTRDLSRALRLTRRLQAGTIWVNRYGRSRDHILPTGGFKGSGIGKDLGREAFRASRRSKSVLVALR